MIRLLPFILIAPAYAGPYAEFGLSHSFDSCLYDEWKKSGKTINIGCSDSPLGSVAIGYTYKGWSIEASHYSSLVETDKGLNLLSIKYRIGK
jgi:hypothetical protein